MNTIRTLSCVLFCLAVLPHPAQAVLDDPNVVPLVEPTITREDITACEQDKWRPSLIDVKSCDWVGEGMLSYVTSAEPDPTDSVCLLDGVEKVAKVCSGKMNCTTSEGAELGFNVVCQTSNEKCEANPCFKNSDKQFIEKCKQKRLAEKMKIYKEKTQPKPETQPETKTNTKPSVNLN